MFNCSTLNISALMSWCKLQVMLIHFNCARLIPQFSLSFSLSVFLCVCFLTQSTRQHLRGYIKDNWHLFAQRREQFWFRHERYLSLKKSPLLYVYFMVMHLVRSNILVKWCHLHYIELLAIYCTAAVPIFIRKEFCLCLVNIWIN